MELANKILQASEPLMLLIVSALFAALANEVRAKVHSTRAQGILLRLADLAETVTNELGQTVVDAARKPGEQLNAAFAADVKALAMTKVKAHLGPKGLSEVLSVFGFKSVGEAEALIASKIESAVADTKKFSPLAVLGETTDLPPLKA